MDVAIALLALIHLLMCIIRTHLDLGIWEFQDFWNNITCKAFIYLYRLMRSLLVSTTCLLSVLQATTLSPRSFFLAKSKHTSPQCSHHFRIFSLMGILRDIFLMGLMALSSGYMVALLCRHKRQCQHIQSTSLSPRASPELRAIRTILLLMGLFVLKYFVDCVFSSSSRQKHKDNPTRLGVQMLVGNGYATLSALILICADQQTLGFF
ncbi:vomeronasal type-1 receptor 90-like [Ictidomys tridecemlineatus]|uniref:vomeronasal type-1 receptor 90-like n=1 Tax=Ictidomys tridecemlineatus TaxID=43179 RepID=UPI0006829E5E|nr:vomeronasal type-1 receptor 90-like [Ictidomys tridecemlineatus]KAG3255499.1 vomeronasal type-1 receptor 90-like [Ictidomys tridecemlineatus]